MPLHGEDLTRPTYEALRTLHGGAINLTLGVWRHKILGVDVVQKTIDMAGRQDAAAYQEPRLLHRIRHAHIVPVHEAQFDPELEDAITFVMPVYEGGSVDKALEADYRFSLDQVRLMGMQILSALAYLHGEPLAYIHRDVKPANILLDFSREKAFLSDFGSAAKIDGSGTVDALDMTPFYQAPEARPAGRVDIRADLYSLAITLFEMLNGRFRYEHTSFERVQKRLTDGRRAMPDSWLVFAPHVPDSLRRVIRKGLEREPARRWRSARAFSRELGRLKLVDWRHEEGSGLDGRWVGTWPPNEAEHRRASYMVTSEPIRGGRLRLTAYQRLPDREWRQFGVARRSVADDDRRAVDEIFAEVSTRAAHLRPER